MQKKYRTLISWKYPAAFYNLLSKMPSTTGWLTGKRQVFLKISFKPYGPGCLCCEIEDNGIGRKASSGKQVFEAHEPKGTAMLSERIEILKKLDKLVIDFYITDLENESGEATGTRVSVTSR